VFSALIGLFIVRISQLRAISHHQTQKNIKFGILKSTPGLFILPNEKGNSVLTYKNLIISREKI
jgi:hypothetical protein